MGVALAGLLLTACDVSAPESGPDAEELSSSPAESEGNGQEADARAVQFNACGERPRERNFLNLASAGDSGRFIVDVFEIVEASGETGDPVFLNVGDAYPRHSASVVAFTNAAPEVTAYMRETLQRWDVICATGTVRLFEGRPQLVVDSLDELVFMYPGDRPSKEELEGRREALSGVRAGCEQAGQTIEALQQVPDQMRFMQDAVNLLDWPDGEGLEFRTGGAIAADAISGLVGAMDDASLYLYVPPGAPPMPDYVRNDIMQEVADAAWVVYRACKRLG